MSISTQLSAIAKYVFPTGVPHAFYTKNPGLGDAVKKTDAAKGESYKFSVSYSQGAAGSATYADAYAVANNARYERFSVTSRRWLNPIVMTMSDTSCTPNPESSARTV